MACPLTVAKFVGTISLGLLTGLSYSASAITIPSLSLLSTSANASRSLHEVKRLNSKHSFRLCALAEACILFAYCMSPRHRRHPYLIWMTVTSQIATFGVDYWYHGQNGFVAWLKDIVQPSKKEDDIVVVENEETVNGESVRKEMDLERRMQRSQAVFSGIAFAMGVVGIWGERRL